MRPGVFLAASLAVALCNLPVEVRPAVDANGNQTPEVAGANIGGDQAAELAKQLQNPVASLITPLFPTGGKPKPGAVPGTSAK